MINRRMFIATIGATAFTGCAARRSMPVTAGMPPLPTRALSLQRLQAGLARGSTPDALHLAALNRFEGFFLEGDDVVVFGRVDPNWGLHLIDINLAQGDLLRIAGAQAAAWKAKAQ